MDATENPRNLEGRLHYLPAAFAAEQLPGRLSEAEPDHNTFATNNQVSAGRNHLLEYFAAAMRTEWTEAGVAA